MDFLREIEHPDALAWANQWSERTLNKYAHAPESNFTELSTRIEDALNDDTRIPYVLRRGEFLYNFHRDAKHQRGLWRRCTLMDYLESEDDTLWQVLLDLDALATTEEENWVWKGASVLPYSYDRALIHLSRGGADAVVIREFDLNTCKFVTEEPFNVPEAKSVVSWVDHDTVLLGTDFGPASLTSSGYPMQARVWHRGTDFSAAEELFTGKDTDIAVTAWADTTEGFERIFVARSLDFYHRRTFVQTPDGLQILETPEDCRVAAYRDWLFVLPRTEYAGVPAGGVGVINFARFMAGSRKFLTLYSPNEHTSVQDIAFSKQHLIITLLEDVQTSIQVIALGQWDNIHNVPLPEATTASVVATDHDSEEVWVSTSSFGTPDSLYRVQLQHLEKGVIPPVVVRQAPCPFYAQVETRQHWATSADGTQIPYFIVGDFSADVPKPTLAYAYGGFEVSLLPGFSVPRGIGWLESGGFYVQANLRGGGEFGPQWHEQVTTQNRLKVYEDFEAVLDDVVARGYTTPAQLGVRGGSNGGLLTAVALTRFPEKFGAAVVQVPLIDMLQYHTMLAGASWMAEYGNPEDPADRAVIEQYSPLQNVVSHEQRPYPPALVTTSTRDDRVHPGHARVFAQALEDAGQPVDYYENTEGGHAGAANNTQVARTEALVWTWLWQQLSGTAR